MPTKLFILIGALFIGVFGFVTSALAVETPAYSCDQKITINDNPDEWNRVSDVVTDTDEISGTTWYYAGTTWSTTPSVNDTYSTVIDEMFDIEDVKLCNSATNTYIYFATYYPFLKIFDIAGDEYYEFGDPNGAGNSIGLPEDFDMWFVIKMAETDSLNEVYYFTAHFSVAVGETDISSPIMEKVIYQETDIGSFTEVSFNPNEDTNLFLFNDYNNKEFDNETAYELKFALLSTDASSDLFSNTHFEYDDTIQMQIFTYNDLTLKDQTSIFSYILEGVSVGDVTIPKKYRTTTSAKIKWHALSGASKYKIQLRNNKGKRLRTKSTQKKNWTFKNLKPGKRYQIRIRAKVADAFTPWTNIKKFKTLP
ncbi:MAG: fibronectin type III domain-containing protein [bacterium]|nr:fibronectin type III domain-containing protein [bacterium]